MVMTEKLPVLKVVIAGDGAVGKTSLIRRYCEGKFEASRVETIGVDFQTQTVNLPTGRVKLSIWDMAGQERFQVIRAGFYRGSRASALVFDVTQPATLMSLHRWKDEILEVVREQPFLVVGNKIDLQRAVSSEKGKAFANSIGAPYLETSALTGNGVAALFETIAKLAHGS
jgi:small GTP-binding protein